MDIANQTARSASNDPKYRMLLPGGLVALALGSALGAQPASAALIIYNSNTNIAPGSSVNFGPLGDEQAFTLSNYGLDIFIGQFDSLGLAGNGTPLSPSINTVSVDPVTPTDLKYYYPGDTVDGSATFATSGTSTVKVGGTAYYGLQSINPVADPFGWVEVQSLGNGDLELLKFGFEDSGAGANIPADVPEPGTLSLLAVGAAGVIGARRRRRKRAV